jgi:hypothetical protein
MQVLSSYPSTTQAEKAQDNKTTATTTGSDVTATNATDTAQESSTAKKTFSTRAEKFSQLNKEFDITSSKFTITTEFVNRLAELNIISSEEAQSLSVDLKASDSTKETNSVGDLKTGVDALIERVKPEAGTEGLIAILEKSQKILDNLDGSKSKEFPVDPATAAAEIEHFLKSDNAKILTNEETSLLKDLKLAMNIADKLNPEQRSSAEVSKYMEILKQFS